MKKLAIGCGIVVLVLGIAFVGGAFYIGMKVKGTVTQLAELSKVPEIEHEVRVKTRFTPPETGELTAQQVDRFVGIQKRVRDRLGEKAAQFERTYQSLKNKKEATAADLPTLLSAYSDLAAMFVDAKRTQVAALNDAGLGLDEYRWIRSAAYQAIGAPYMDVDFARIAADAKAGRQQAVMPATLEGAFRGTPPDANVKLVEKFKKQLEDNLALASFGL
ncbi:MAG TPA: hypothetical protein VEU08_16280 [Vicinamibacterales bacterium]|nr:hypothetical protein [Vicinamibacterales bacterium]